MVESLLENQGVSSNLPAFLDLNGRKKFLEISLHALIIKSFVKISISMRLRPRPKPSTVIIRTIVKGRILKLRQLCYEKSPFSPILDVMTPRDGTETGIPESSW